MSGCYLHNDKNVLRFVLPNCILKMVKMENPGAAAVKGGPAQLW